MNSTKMLLYHTGLICKYWINKQYSHTAVDRKHNKGQKHFK